MSTLCRSIAISRRHDSSEFTRALLSAAMPGHSSILLLEHDFCHHAFVLVIQQMAMKYGHASDDGICKVQDDVHGAANGNVHSIQPCRIGEGGVILGISQEVNLVNVERM
jgi:hypothetical protein